MYEARVGRDRFLHLLQLLLFLLGRWATDPGRVSLPLLRVKGGILARGRFSTPRASIHARCADLRSPGYSQEGRMREGAESGVGHSTFGVAFVVGVLMSQSRWQEEVALQMKYRERGWRGDGAGEQESGWVGCRCCRRSVRHRGKTTDGQEPRRPTDRSPVLAVRLLDVGETRKYFGSNFCS